MVYTDVFCKTGLASSCGAGPAGACTVGPMQKFKFFTWYLGRLRSDRSKIYSYVEAEKEREYTDNDMVDMVRLPLIIEFQSAQVPFHIRRLPWSMLYHLVP